MLLFVALWVAGCSSASDAPARVTVKPTTGSPDTRFVVNFRAPEPSGHSGVFARDYSVSASGPSGTRCISRVSAHPRASRKGALVQVTFDPAKLHGPWCAGTYRGSVNETQGPWCPPNSRVCPEFATRIQVIGRFSFRVRSVGDTTPPTFAGLKSAVACTPGPQREGQTTPYSLSWNHATDNVTPSSQIVYDVYMSTRAGGEDFARPTWTTTPGVTSFKTPGLASHGSFYFVVRARDRAGNEDHNRVERQGIDACY